MKHSERAEKLLGTSREKGMDAVVVSSEANMRYFSGFTGDSGVLFIAAGRRVLLTDSRYREDAREQAPDYEYLEFSAAKPLWQALKEVAADAGAKRLGFEDRTMVYGDYVDMSLAVGGEWAAASQIMGDLRAIKDEEEMTLMRRAGKIGDEAFSHILSFIKPGMKELDIALELEYFMRKAGAAGNSFDPIAASGPNGSRPHAMPTDRELQTGDLLTLDFGCVVEGYCSDMTRTVAIGRLAEEALSVYNIVLDAQRTAAAEARPGMRGSEVDAIARDIIAASGYGKDFGHGLGHSLGIDVHEEPRFSPSCETVIQENMMMTIEPGIYLDGRFGVRIEDFGVMTRDGFKAFSRSPKELLYV